MGEKEHHVLIGLNHSTEYKRQWRKKYIGIFLLLYPFTYLRSRYVASIVRHMPVLRIH